MAGKKTTSKNRPPAKPSQKTGAAASARGQTTAKPPSPKARGKGAAPKKARPARASTSQACDAQALQSAIDLTGRAARNARSAVQTLGDKNRRTGSRPPRSQQDSKTAAPRTARATRDGAKKLGAKAAGALLPKTSGHSEAEGHDIAPVHTLVPPKAKKPRGKKTPAGPRGTRALQDGATTDTTHTP